MKVGSWNLRGLSDKQGQLAELLREENLDVLCYQESGEYNGTNLRNVIKSVSSDYRLAGYWSWRRDEFEGTGLIVKGPARDLTESHLPKYLIDHRNVVYIEYNGVRIVGLHGPWLMTDHKIRWWNELLDWLAINKPDILLGDFNIADGQADETEPCLDAQALEIMERLKSLGYAQNEASGSTWFHDHNDRSLRIDYVMTHGQYSSTSSRTLIKYRDKQYRSDHVPLVCDVEKEGINRPLMVVQFFPYQYNQFKALADAIGADVVYKTTEQEFEAGARWNGVYRTIDGKFVSTEELQARGYTYVVYTSRPYAGLSKLAQWTKKKVGYCIPHSLIGTRYDVSLGLADFNDLIGMLPEGWIGTDACSEEMDTRRPSKYIVTKSNPLVAQVIERAPRVKVEPDTLAVILGCLSAFRSYYPIVKALQEWYEKTHFRTLAVKVKFHPLTKMDDVRMFTEDPTFEILPTQMDKYDFTDSCEYIIGGASSLMTEAWLRGKHFGTHQKFTQFPDRRGTGFRVATSNLERVEFTIITAESNIDSMLVEDPIQEIQSAMENFEWGQEMTTNPSKWTPQ